jgi:hypothetical protein
VVLGGAGSKANDVWGLGLVLASLVLRTDVSCDEEFEEYFRSQTTNQVYYPEEEDVQEGPLYSIIFGEVVSRPVDLQCIRQLGCLQYNRDNRDPIHKVVKKLDTLLVHYTDHTRQKTRSESCSWCQWLKNR